MRFLFGILVVACGAPKQPPRVVHVEPSLDAAPPDAAVARTDPPHAVQTSATQIVIEDEWGGLGCSYTFHARLERKDDDFVGTATLDVPRTASKDTRAVTLAISEVEALERMVSETEKGPDPGPADRQRGWTDDYPKGSTILSGPNDSMKLFFRDQQRQLLVEHGGQIQSLGPGSFRPGGPTSDAWRKYRAFLDAVGFSAMLDKRCK